MLPANILCGSISHHAKFCNSVARDAVLGYVPFALTERRASCGKRQPGPQLTQMLHGCWHDRARGVQATHQRFADFAAKWRERAPSRPASAPQAASAGLPSASLPAADVCPEVCHSTIPSCPSIVVSHAHRAAVLSMHFAVYGKHGLYAAWRQLCSRFPPETAAHLLLHGMSMPCLCGARRRKCRHNAIPAAARASL